jgi:hypothetical protein
MGKRKLEKDFLTEYNQYISHRYTRSRRGPISDFELRVWSTRKPYSRMFGILYLLSGLFIILLFILSGSFKQWDYKDLYLLLFVVFAVIMIVWGIKIIISG